MSKPTKNELEALNHIHSLGIISENQISHAMINALLERQWIRMVWIGNYALTETGKRACREATPQSD